MTSFSSENLYLKVWDPKKDKKSYILSLLGAIVTKIVIEFYSLLNELLTLSVFFQVTYCEGISIIQLYRQGN